VVIKKQTLVATLPATGAPGSRKPGGPTSLHIPGHWLHARSILPVIGQQAGWVHVRLAQRPNGSTAWVRNTYVTLATDPYQIVIDLSATHLQLYKDGRQVGNYPVGVGLPANPTPTGSYFAALFTRAPSPAWGSFVIITSAHSNTISDWEATGDAITAIHGPLGSDAQIGTTGARVSHGCVRMHNADLLHMRLVPAGTPIDIHA
jgi:lipoprotein-anchoring transpeptidase ErfK/SrfK